jgi:phosphatidate cytidylyltransferase
MAHHLARRILVAAIGIPATIALLYLGAWILAWALAALGVLGALEFYRLAESRGLRPVRVVGALGAALLPAGTWMAHPAGGGIGWQGLAVVAALWLLAVQGAATALRRPDQGPMAAVGITVFGALYAGGLPAFLLWLRYPAGATGAWAGTALAGLPLVLTWICDTGAMAGGVMIGGRKLAPLLSPAKTWAGALAGAAAAAVAAPLYGRWVLGPSGVSVSWTLLLACGLAVATVGQLGDVAESLFKREAGVKDSGGLLPGHGGVLDRLDSLYWNIPVVTGLLWAGKVL